MNLPARSATLEDRQSVSPKSNPRLRLELAKAFRKHPVPLAESLFQSLTEARNEPPAKQFGQLEDWERAHFMAAIEIAAKWLKGDGDRWCELFAGWIHSRLFVSADGESGPVAYPASRTLALAKGRWLTILTPKLSGQAVEALASQLDRVISLLGGSARRKLKILFIGDCIQYEIVTALLGACVLEQIDFTPVMLHERVQAALRNRVRTLDPGEFDLIFFSPFSHAFVPEYDQLLRPKASLCRTTDLLAAVDILLEDVLRSVQVIAKHFRCPIYIHNTAGTIQTFGVTRGLLKNIASWRNRRLSAKVINSRISRYCADPAFEGRVRLIDENSVRDGMTNMQLARVLHCGELFHPTRLGVELGRRTCFTAIYSQAFLVTKKVVVCDLDNTLWRGVIGEGAVAHCVDRQAILKDLRTRGVLLSINSKNSENNVQFSGGVLQTIDFVAPRINWLPKVQNMASIVAELNFKVKDCVFVDDRPDELERMQETFPEMVTLNAENPATWGYLAHWRDHLPLAQEEDRTTLYHERVARQSFLTSGNPGEVDPEDEIAAIQKLQLRLKIEEAGPSNLSRVAELINRTNQFNLCGSRTTVQELAGRMGDGHRTLIASAQDKFGNMGMVGVMRVNWTPAGLEIPIFVLSCRVFGFGIEYALLNAVKRLTAPDSCLIGHYHETHYNQPGRDLYRKAGMLWDGAKWSGRVADLRDNPSWLTVQYRVSPAAELTNP